MQFIQAKNPDDGAQKFADEVVGALRGGKKVLWLISGGSNIPISTEILQMIKAEVSMGEIKNLTVTLADERFGPVGHENSNWQLIKDNGFDFENMTAIPILENVSLEDTVLNANMRLKKAINDSDFIIGQLGIGTDGHIAGIFPDSPATDLENMARNDFVCAYKSASYTRITITFPVFRIMDVAYAFAFGDLKRQAMKRLQDRLEIPEKLPSLILYEVPQAFLYSDVIEQQ